MTVAQISQIGLVGLLVNGAEFRLNATEVTIDGEEVDRDRFSVEYEGTMAIQVQRDSGTVDISGEDIEIIA